MCGQKRGARAARLAPMLRRCAAAWRDTIGGRGLLAWTRGRPTATRVRVGSHHTHPTGTPLPRPRRPPASVTKKRKHQSFTNENFFLAARGRAIRAVSARDGWVQHVGRGVGAVGMDVQHMQRAHNHDRGDLQRLQRSSTPECRICAQRRHRQLVQHVGWGLGREQERVRGLPPSCAIQGGRSGEHPFPCGKAAARGLSSPQDLACLASAFGVGSVDLCSGAPRRGCGHR